VKRGLLLAGALLAAAAAPPEPVSDPPVGPIDPRASHSDSAGPVAIDMACANVTVATAASDPGCAAKLARGETGTVLIVAAKSMSGPGATPESFAAALALVDKAIAAENRGAAHYLAGNLLTTGQIVAPDYARGLPHLEAGVAGGSPAAADLLGIMALEGRGMPRDVARAVALFRQAAAGGMGGSAVRLAQLYLNGRDLPRDEATARRILAAAAAAGDPRAQVPLMMLDGEDKVSNYQIHPAADPAKVEVRRYRTFDNPAIPPAFGFTDEFQRLHYSAFSDPAALAGLERDYASLPTPYIYELARRIGPHAPDKGRGYLLLARMRMVYDARRCPDRQAIEAVTAWDGLMGPDLAYLFRRLDPAGLKAALDFAFAREAALPGDSIPWWVCYSGLAMYGALADGKPVPVPLTDKAEWPRVRQEVHDAMAEISLPSPPR
jgi:uncharacterized protein